MAFAYIDCSLSLSLSPKKKWNFGIIIFLGQKKWNHHFLGPTPTARWQKGPQSTPRLAMAPQQKLKLPQAWQTNQAPQQKPNKAQRSTEQPQDAKKTERVENWNLTSKKNNASNLMSEFLWVNQHEGVSSRFIWRPVTLLLQIWQHCLTKLRLKGGIYSTWRVCILIASCRSFCADCPKNVHHPSHLKNGLLIRRCSIRFS